VTNPHSSPIPRERGTASADRTVPASVRSVHPLPLTAGVRRTGRPFAKGRSLRQAQDGSTPLTAGRQGEPPHLRPWLVLSPSTAPSTGDESR
jgi:hypothetical protein